MPRITWDNAGDKKFEAGVDHCVLYPAVGTAYPAGYAWNGITSIAENPEGGDAQDFYADNIKYGSLRGAENFGGTIECYTYPEQWKACDGRKDLIPGITMSQQTRKGFGLSYRTLMGSDAVELGGAYTLHLIYGATASPSSKTRSTINESPEAGTMSYEFKTTPVGVSKVDNAKATSHLEIDSDKVTEEQLTAIENILYGTEGTITYSTATTTSETNPFEEGLYEKSGNTYFPSQDTEVDPQKTYYIRTESGGTAGRLPLPDELYDILTA